MTEKDGDPQSLPLNQNTIDHTPFSNSETNKGAFIFIGICERRLKVSLKLRLSKLFLKKNVINTSYFLYLGDLYV